MALSFLSEMLNCNTYCCIDLGIRKIAKSNYDDVMWEHIQYYLRFFNYQGKVYAQSNLLPNFTGACHLYNNCQVCTVIWQPLIGISWWKKYGVCISKFKSTQWDVKKNSGRARWHKIFHAEEAPATQNGGTWYMSGLVYEWM